MRPLATSRHVDPVKQIRCRRFHGCCSVTMWRSSRSSVEVNRRVRPDVASDGGGTTITGHGACRPQYPATPSPRRRRRRVPRMIRSVSSTRLTRTGPGFPHGVLAMNAISAGGSANAVLIAASIAAVLARMSSCAHGGGILPGLVSGQVRTAVTSVMPRRRDSATANRNAARPDSDGDTPTTSPPEPPATMVTLLHGDSEIAINFAVRRTSPLCLTEADRLPADPAVSSLWPVRSCGGQFRRQFPKSGDRRSSSTIGAGLERWAVVRTRR